MPSPKLAIAIEMRAQKIKLPVYRERRRAAWHEERVLRRHARAQVGQLRLAGGELQAEPADQLHGEAKVLRELFGRLRDHRDVVDVADVFGPGGGERIVERRHEDVGEHARNGRSLREAPRLGRGQVVPGPTLPPIPGHVAFDLAAAASVGHGDSKRGENRPMGQLVEELLDVEFRDPAMAVLPDQPVKRPKSRTAVGALPPPLRPAAVATRRKKGVVCASLQKLERGPEAESITMGVDEDKAMLLADEPLDPFGVIRRVDAVHGLVPLVAGEPPWWLPVEAAGADPTAREDREFWRDKSRWLDTPNSFFSGRSPRTFGQPILDEIEVACDGCFRHDELPATNEKRCPR
jgi:hypothetical protein